MLNCILKAVTVNMILSEEVYEENGIAGVSGRNNTYNDK